MAAVEASAFDCCRVWRSGDSVLQRFLYGSVIAQQLRWEFRRENLGSHMNKFLTGTIAAIAVAATAPAFAADMAARYSKAPPPAPVMVYNWTGCYIGGNVGGGWARTQQSQIAKLNPAPIAPTPIIPNNDFGSSDSNGNFIGGGQ